MRPRQQRFDPESLKEQARRHWQEFNPRKYRDLKASGQLEQSLSAAVQSTLQAMEDDRQAGYNQWEAWEKNRSLHLLLPEEPDPKAERPPPNPAYDALVAKNKALDQEQSGLPEK